MPVAVSGLRELQAALAKGDRDTRLGVRAELRHVAEPVRSSAEQLASSTIRNIGPRWPRMRVGVTRTLVYVAPRQRGIRARGDPRKRSNLADLLADRAMEPALHQHEHEIEQRVEQLIDRVADRFNRGV